MLKSRKNLPDRTYYIDDGGWTWVVSVNIMNYSGHVINVGNDDGSVRCPPTGKYRPVTLGYDGITWRLA